MCLVEIVINLGIDLPAVARGLTDAEQIVETPEMAEKTVARHIQTVHGGEGAVCVRKVIRRRHERDSPLDKPGAVRSRAELVPWRAADRAIGTIGVRTAGGETYGTEHADITELTGVRCPIRIRRWRQWTAIRIYNGPRRIRAGGDCRRTDSGVVPVIEVPENAIARAWRQHACIRVGALSIKIHIPQGKKERLILHDRAAHTNRAVIVIRPVWRQAGTVIGPGIRIQLGVLDIPYRRSAQLIRS